MDRRTFLSTVSISALGGLALAQTSSPAADRINVLFIMTDELSAKAVGYAGNPDVRTPNIDALARNGVVFDNACCTYPVCTASRCSILTGQWPHTHGNNENCGLPETDPALGLPPDAKMTESILFENGYVTKHRGKWHCGDQKRHACYDAPDGFRYMQRDYPEWLKQAMPPEKLNAPAGNFQCRDYPVYMTPEMFEAQDAYRRKNENQKGYYPWHLMGRWALPAQYHDDTHFTDQVLELMDQYGDKPFMMTCSMNSPHNPWIISNPYYSSYDPASLTLPKNKTREPYYTPWEAAQIYDLFGENEQACLREYLRCYYAMVTLMDDQVGRLVKKLKDIGQFDNTLIVFSSDHGDMMGAHSLVTKGVSAFYDEIVRVPLLLHCPKLLPKGRRVKTAANGIDVMPTILDLLDMPVPDAVQGESLVPYIKGREDMDKPGYCERTQSGYVNRMIRTHEWRYSFHYRHGTLEALELFHIAKDPGEERNLAADPNYKDVLKRLDAQLRTHLKRTDDKLVAALPALEG